MNYNLKILLVIFLLLTTYIIDQYPEKIGGVDIIKSKEQFQENDYYISKKLHTDELQIHLNKSGRPIRIIVNGKQLTIDTNSIFEVVKNSYVDSNKIIIVGKNNKLVFEYSKNLNIKYYGPSTDKSINVVLKKDGTNYKITGYDGEIVKDIDNDIFDLEIARIEEPSYNICFYGENKIKFEIIRGDYFQTMKIPLTNTINISFNNEKCETIFLSNENNNDFILFIFLESYIDYLVEVTSSKLIALLLFLTSISLILVPLELYIQAQNSTLKNLSKDIDLIKGQNLNQNIEVRELNKLYKNNGVKGGGTTAAFIVKIFLYIFSIFTILDAYSIRNITFMFIENFSSVGDGWLVSWIFILFYFLELFISKRKVVIDKNQLFYLFLFLFLSFYLLTPLIVLVMCFFSLIRILSIYRVINK